MPGRPTAVFGVVVTVAAIGLVAVVALAAIYTRGLVPRSEPPIRSDALSYYLYLPAVLVDHDLSFRTTLRRDFRGDFRVADLVPRRRGYLDKHSPGEAFMLLPFFGAAHLAAEVGGSEANGFSRPYQIAAVAGGLLFALLGLTVVGLTLLRMFEPSVVVVTLVALTFGTNLFHYATYDAVYSHVFSFALVALIVERTLAAADAPRVGAAVVLGALLGMLADVRLTNLTIVAFPICVLAWTLRSELRRLLALAGVALVTAALLFVPQVLYWNQITGHPFVNAYGGSPALHPLAPHVFAVAFSVRKGLFFWTPLLVIAVAGIWLLRSWSSPIAAATALTLALHFWIVSSWKQWFYGASLGQRAFVDALPLFALGLAAAVSTILGARLVGRTVGLIGLAVTTFLAAHATLEYWLGNVPQDLTTWHVYVKSFTQL